MRSFVFHKCCSPSHPFTSYRRHPDVALRQAQQKKKYRILWETRWAWVAEVRMERFSLESGRWCVSVSLHLVDFMEPPTDGDYSIFQWRQNESTDPPTIYLKDPSEPLPSQSSYRNPSFYLFHPDHTVPVQLSPQSDSPSARSKKRSTPNGGVPKHKKEFEDFHTSNGVRTISGDIGPVKNGTRTTTFSGMSP